MKTTNLYLIFAAILALPLFIACKKSDSGTPSGVTTGAHGSITYEGSTINFNNGGSVDSAGEFIVSAISTGGATTYSIGVYQKKKPTTAGSVSLGDSNLVILTSTTGTTTNYIRYFAEATQKLNYSISGGKVTYSFTNLKQTLALSGGTSTSTLTGNVSQ